MYRVNSIKYTLWVLCLLSIPVLGWAEPAKETRLEKINAKVERENSRLARLSSKVEQSSKALSAKRKKLKDLLQQEKAMERKLKEVEGRRSRLRTEIKNIDREIITLRKLSLRRLRSLFMHKKENFVEKILISSDSSQLVRDTFFYSKVREFDVQVLEALADLLKSQQTKKGELDDAVFEQRILNGELQEQRGNIETQVQEEKKLIQKLKREKKGVQDILLALRAEALRLETVVKSMMGGSLVESEQPFVSTSRKNAAKKLSASSGFKGRSLALQKGGLIKPIAGKVVRKYGKYQVSGFSDYVFSKGLEFFGEEGATARVIADGRIMYYGRMPGYGQILIVDHGDRYYSLYGLLHKVLVSAGDVVAKGEELALIGKPDASGKNFYFEIRKNGNPVNPEKFFPKGFRTVYTGDPGKR